MVMLRALIQAASVGRQALRQLALHVDAGQRALDQCRAAHTECLCRAARAGCQAARAACWCRAARAGCQCRAARAWCRDDLAAHTRIHWLPLQRTMWDITARQPMAASLLLLGSALAVLTIYELGNFSSTCPGTGLGEHEILYYIENIAFQEKGILKIFYQQYCLKCQQFCMQYCSQLK